MVERAFRFGVVAGQVESGVQWTGFVRRVEDSGFTTLLVPDTINVAAPFSALAAAAAVTTDLRLGTFVLAAPLRSATAIAWETASLDRLCDGRFELGLGAGRPDAAREAELFGLPFGTPGERVDMLADTLRVLRETFDDAANKATSGPYAQVNYLAPVQRPRPPIMLAAGGKRMLDLAAREADIVNLALHPASGEAEVAEKVRLLRDLAGARFDALELCYNTFSVGEGNESPWLARQFGIQAEQVADNKALAVLTGSPAEIAEVLLRRRAELGISYIAVNQNAMAGFIPVIDLLAGK
jgi:probable F420-dependent oxidoreductase